jgi:hypothetical protein
VPDKIATKIRALTCNECSPSMMLPSSFHYCQGFKAGIAAAAALADQEPRWHDAPPERGLYLYAAKAMDWDINEPVPVCSVDYCDGKGEFLTANYRRERVLVAEMPGIWWGPLPIPTYADRPIVPDVKTP